MDKLYFINYTKQFADFLSEKQINYTVSVSDIICLRMYDAWNDSPFAMLMLEFAEWLISQRDTLN